MLQVVRILKTLFLVLYLEFKTSLSLVTQVLFQQGCLTYRQEDGLLHHMLLNELEFNVKKGGGGQTKKTAYAIQFPILVRCSCLFARVKLQKVNAVLFSVLVEHLHVMLITCFPCMSFTGTTSTFSVASSSKNWRKTSNETCCLKNNNVIRYIKHVLTDFFPFLSFFPFLTVFSVERKAI